MNIQELIEYLINTKKRMGNLPVMIQSPYGGYNPLQGTNVKRVSRIEDWSPNDEFGEYDDDYGNETDAIRIVRLAI